MRARNVEWRGDERPIRTNREVRRTLLLGSFLFLAWSAMSLPATFSIVATSEAAAQIRSATKMERKRIAAMHVSAPRRVNSRKTKKPPPGEEAASRRRILARRPSRLFLVHRRGDLVELGADFLAQVRRGSDDHDRNECGDQAVFDGRRAGFVVTNFLQKLRHF